jgi:cyclopropane-fatty-acyl-phospholipid synthase
MPPQPTAAIAFAPVWRAQLGADLPVRVRYWDGSTDGPPDNPVTMVFQTPKAMRRVLYCPNEVGLARAYICGEITVEGDLHAALRSLQLAAPDEFRLPPRVVAEALRQGIRLGVIGRPLPRPPEEAKVRGRLHSKRRDAEAVSHHYDVGNDFYRLVLGPSMTYSCARFTTPDATLEEAQAAKYDLICRKLGLQAGMRLLDVGCGWGGMVMHAARNYGVDAVGITLSKAQSDLAQKRVAEAGLGGSVEIRLQDYRDLTAERRAFDAISSIGMFEHVGRAQMAEYFRVLTSVLGDRGRLLNHAISTPNGAAFDRRSFVARYVFPDGELQDTGVVMGAMEDQDLEVRDVESLREHYALTLGKWVENLEASWDEAVSLVGPRRARIWQLYMLGSIVSFETNEIAIHQVLGVKTPADGNSGMPPTRAGMV